MRKRKLLFITQWWPLHNSPNVLCDYKIIQELLKKRNDLEIHIVCYRAPGEQREEFVDGVYAHRVSLDISTFLYLKSKTIKQHFLQWILVNQWKLFSKIKMILLLPFFPKFHPILENRLLKTAIKVNNLEHFDLLFADHAGFDTLESGYRFSKKTNINFFPLFWDCLSCGRPIGFLSKTWQVKKKVNAEKVIIDQSKSAFVLLPNQNKITSLYKDQKERLSKFTFIGVPYLQDKKQPAYSELKRVKNRIKIVFGGSLHGCELKPFLNSINKIRCDIDFDIVFYVSEVFHKKLKKEIKNLNLDKIIRIEKTVSHDEYLRIISNSDILLNFGNNTIEALPSKIFEYISMCKPIITTSTTTNDSSAVIIKNYKKGFVFENNKCNEKKHIQELKDFIKFSNNENNELDYQQIKSIFKEYTVEEVTKTIEKTCDF